MDRSPERLRRELLKGLARARLADQFDPLEAKLQLARRLPDDTLTVAVIIDQMDCDCVRYTSRRVVPNTVIHAIAAINRAFENAEGPIYGVTLAHPDAPFTAASRDLALEAFEEGHAHVVYH